MIRSNSRVYYIFLLLCMMFSTSYTAPPFLDCPRCNHVYHKEIVIDKEEVVTDCDESSK